MLQYLIGAASPMSTSRNTHSALPSTSCRKQPCVVYDELTHFKMIQTISIKHGSILLLLLLAEDVKIINTHEHSCTQIYISSYSLIIKCCFYEIHNVSYPTGSCENTFHYACGYAAKV